MLPLHIVTRFSSVRMTRRLSMALPALLLPPCNDADAAIVLVTESHRTRLLRQLRTQGVDIDGAIERGTYLSFDADVST